MNFDWQGLNNERYFILSQKNNPLKYCNYALPFPLPIGLPFMPCDLPNEYELISTDSTYESYENVFLNFEEDIGLLERILIPASHRPWSMQGRDYYNHVPYRAFRNFNTCFSPSDRPQIKVYLQDKYIGRVQQTTICNCCCFFEKFQQFEIFNENDQLLYRVCSRNPQRGHFIILPFCGFDRIYYDIVEIFVNEQNNTLSEQQIYEFEEKEKKVGEIVHLFNGIAEYTSKNDKYGISLPEAANEANKCLIIHCTLLIDYLLFENF